MYPTKARDKDIHIGKILLPHSLPLFSGKTTMKISRKEEANGVIQDSVEDEHCQKRHNLITHTHQLMPVDVRVPIRLHIAV